MTSPVSSRAAGLRDRLSSLASGSVSSVISVSSSDHEDSTPMPSTTVPTSLPASPVAVPKEQASPVEKHPEHFYPNGDIKFLVDRTLYQLHSDILARQSGWFRTYLASKYEGDSDGTLPAGWRAEPGPFCTVYVHFGKEKIQFERPSAYNVDEKTGAIVIGDITIQDMDAFLAVLYPMNFLTFGLVTHEYTDVLKVAHMWDCPAISALAIERLDQAWSDHSYSFQRLMLARKYDIKDWIDDALNDLIQDPDPLCLDEIAQMLPEDTLRVTNAREEHARREGLCIPRRTTQAEIPPSRGRTLSRHDSPELRSAVLPSQPTLLYPAVTPHIPHAPPIACGRSLSPANSVSVRIAAPSSSHNDRSRASSFNSQLSTTQSQAGSVSPTPQGPTPEVEPAPPPPLPPSTSEQGSWLERAILQAQTTVKAELQRARRNPAAQEATKLQIRGRRSAVAGNLKSDAAASPAGRTVPVPQPKTVLDLVSGPSLGEWIVDTGR